MIVPVSSFREREGTIKYFAANSKTSILLLLCGKSTRNLNVRDVATALISVVTETIVCSCVCVRVSVCL